MVYSLILTVALFILCSLFSIVSFNLFNSYFNLCQNDPRRHKRRRDDFSLYAAWHCHFQTNAQFPWASFAHHFRLSWYSGRSSYERILEKNGSKGFAAVGCTKRIAVAGSGEPGDQRNPNWAKFARLRSILGRLSVCNEQRLDLWAFLSRLLRVDLSYHVAQLWVVLAVGARQ